MGSSRAGSFSVTFMQTCCLAVCAFDAFSGEEAQLSILHVGLFLT